MEQMISRCGLICTDCGAYQATLADDDEMRKKVAQEWSKMYGADIKPDNIRCLGCLNDEVLFSHCMVCEIRKCAVERGLDNCGLCGDYTCETIEKFFEFVPDAKKVLDKIHANQ